MSKIIRVGIDENLKNVLSKLQFEVADKMKKEYNLKEVTIHGTLASQILAAKMQGKKSMSFKINKIGLNKGFLELL